MLNMGGWTITVTHFNLGAGLNGQALAQEAARRLPGLAVTLVTGNPEAYGDYRLRSWERPVATPSVGADLVEAVRDYGSLINTASLPHPQSALATAPS